jgi:hypothetical protein
MKIQSIVKLFMKKYVKYVLHPHVLYSVQLLELHKGLYITYSEKKPCPQSILLWIRYLSCRVRITRMNASVWITKILLQERKRGMASIKGKIMRLFSWEAAEGRIKDRDKGLDSTSWGWEAFQEDGEHFRRMGSISGGWEVFQEDGKHFSRMGSISVGWEAFQEDGKH